MRKQLVMNDAYIPYLHADEKTQIFYGGSSSGKSFFLAQRVIIDVINGRNYLIVRNVGATIRHSVFNQLRKTIISMGLKELFHISGNLIITYKPTGKQILFSGLDDVEKLKSITPQVGVLTDIWIEEATEVAYPAYKQLTKRLRGITDSEVQMKKRITFSFNPVMKTHWIYNEFFNDWVDNKTVLRKEELLIVKTTYKDNNFLTEDDIYSLENEKDIYFREVYTYGNWGVLSKVIFKNWEVRDLSEDIPRFDRIYNGLDFGFSQDPNALIRVHVDQKKKEIYVFDELYRCEMLDDELAEEVKKRIGTQYIVCDSAEPKSIADLNRRGVKALPAVKGPDSITFGIRFLQGYKIIIDVRCQNFKNEIQSYHWAEDKFGNALRKPVDEMNHLIDALRYATEELQMSTQSGSAKRL